MWQYCLSAWRSGFRSKGVQAVLVLGVALVTVAFLAGFFSPRQPRTVALDVGFSGVRFSLILLALFWIYELVGQEISRRTVVIALSSPIPRGRYILGRFFGVCGLLALAASLLGMLLWLAVLLTAKGYEQQFAVDLGGAYWATIAGLLVDAVVVAAFALLIASLSTVPMLSIAVGGAFAIAGKSIGAVMDYLSRGAEGDVELVSRYSDWVQLIHLILPDLSRLDWRAGALYGMNVPAGMITLSLVMALCYAFVMIFGAAFLFERREFS